MDNYYHDSTDPLAHAHEHHRIGVCAANHPYNAGLAQKYGIGGPAVEIDTYRVEIRGNPTRKTVLLSDAPATIAASVRDVIASIDDTMAQLERHRRRLLEALEKVE